MITATARAIGVLARLSICSSRSFGSAGSSTSRLDDKVLCSSKVSSRVGFSFFMSLVLLTQVKSCLSSVHAVHRAIKASFLDSGLGARSRFVAVVDSVVDDDANESENDAEDDLVVPPEASSPRLLLCHFPLVLDHLDVPQNFWRSCGFEERRDLVVRLGDLLAEREPPADQPPEYERSDDRDDGVDHEDLQMSTARIRGTI